MYNYKATSIRVVDGDTVDVEVDLGFDIKQRMRLRLADINAPERGKPGFNEAKDFVQAWLLHNPQFQVTTLKDRREKYGRYLAVIRPLKADSVEPMPYAFSMNNRLIENGLAVPLTPSPATAAAQVVADETSFIGVRPLQPGEIAGVRLTPPST